MIGRSLFDLGALPGPDDGSNPTDTLQHLLAFMESAGITTFPGSVVGIFGVAIVDVRIEVMKHLAPNAGPDSLCVFDLVPEHWVPGQLEPIQSASVYLRLDDTNTWLRCVVLEAPEAEEADLGDDDDPDYASPYSLTPDRELELGLTFALKPGFGQLRNRGQREDFVAALLAKCTDAEHLAPHVHTIVARAETCHEMGVLPTRVKALKAAGKSTPEIADALGITALKVRRAAATVVPDFLLQALAAKNDDEEP